MTLVPQPWYRRDADALYVDRCRRQRVRAHRRGAARARAAAPVPSADPTPSQPLLSTTPGPTTPDLPPPATPLAPPAAVTYDKGLAITSADGAFALHLSFRSQVRFETFRGDGGEFLSRFSIPRSRLQANGNVFGPDTRYKLEFSLTESGTFSFIKDLFVDQQLAPSVWFRAGQWKRPFNRQELVSDYASEFNERAITAAFAGGGRDLGIAIHNDYEKSPEGLEWIVGMFNGFSGGADRPTSLTTCDEAPMMDITCTTSPPTTLPIDFGPALVARAGWNVGKIKGYTEGDLEGGPLRVAVGVSYKIDLANLSRGNESTVANNLSQGLQADLMLKAEGFGLEVGAYMMKIKSNHADFGALVEPSYFVIPHRLQLAARVALAPVATRNQIEVRAALSYFWQGQAWKWASDVGVLQLTGEDPMTMTSDQPDVQIRSMLQFML